MTVYLRPEGAYIAPSDRTVQGVWIGNGEVDFVPVSESTALGTAIAKGLASSSVGVRHPRQEEWSKQWHRSLDPIVKLARLRSWRAFVREAEMVGIEARSEGSVTVMPYERDARRVDVFYPMPDDLQEVSALSPEAIGGAELASRAKGSMNRMGRYR